MPASIISNVVRILMTVVVAVTAPLIVIPCGELIEGKLVIDDNHHRRHHHCILIRVVFCLVCMLISDFVPNGFVDILSFIGCFCVATTGFVLPSLFYIQLSRQRRKIDSHMDRVFIIDVIALILGIIATCVTTYLTFRVLLVQVATD